MSRALNSERAGWAASGLAVFQRTTGEADIETAMVDLVADLGHLAKKYRLNYIEILRRAIRSWAYEERDPKELGTSPSVSIRIGPIRLRPRRKKLSAAVGVACRQRTRTGSWTTFERRFRPTDSPDQTVWWSREQVPAGIDPHLVWTIVDCEGKLCVSPGFHIVNRIDYVVCEVPWTDEDIHQPSYRYD